MVGGPSLGAKGLRVGFGPGLFRVARTENDFLTENVSKILMAMIRIFQKAKQNAIRKASEKEMVEK